MSSQPTPMLLVRENSWILRRAFNVIIMFSLIVISSSQDSQDPKVCGLVPKVLNPKDGACGDINIRNDVRNFWMLENCTVIEGSLHISLINYVPQEEYDKFSFPLLREITGHMMMFRAFGLRTLRRLFPNLAVIRGQTKFFRDFALVAYEMRDLEELGLDSLTLVNGSVRLTKNYRLCHISSIDWASLTPSNVDPTKHQFMDNRKEQLCPDFCHESCAMTTYQSVSRRRCWGPDAQSCQKNLDCEHCPHGRSCDLNGSCCHELCLGGCTGPTPADCFVCAAVSYQNTCLSHCPRGTYMAFNRRCLTAEECRDMRSGSINRTTNGEVFPKLLVGDSSTPDQCVLKCPPGYMVNEPKNGIPECIRCQGFCPKVCNTTKVTSVEDSAKLYGCSIISGNLEIQISSGRNVDRNLTRNLGGIREVTGYIRVWKSYALLTLHFFRELEIIGGATDKDSGGSFLKGSSLFVADNSNLQEIFPKEQMKKMVIKKGKISFHNNRKLCFNRIEYFKQQLMVTSGLEAERFDATNETNGNLGQCTDTILRLNLSHTITKLSGVLPIHELHLEWDKYNHSETRFLIHYVVRHKEAIEPVRDIFQGRDACSDNDWNIQLVEPNRNASVKNEATDIFFVKSFTKYVIYVQAVTLSDANKSAVSKIMYFNTSTAPPTEPQAVEVKASSPYELIVRWSPPRQTNGNVTHYKVFYHQEAVSPEGFEQRDYCKDPNHFQQEQIAEPVQDKALRQLETVTGAGPLCCSCSVQEDKNLERARELEIVLENQLLNTNYDKIWGITNDDPCRPSSEILEKVIPSSLSSLNLINRHLRRRREQSSVGLDFNQPIVFHYITSTTMENSSQLPSNASSVTESVHSSLKQEVIVYSSTSASLSNLRHFQSYGIEIVACHETDEVTGIKLCGISAVIMGQTAAHPLADNLNSSLVSVTGSTRKAVVRWKPPEQPNGLILKYYIKYSRVDLGRQSSQTVCVSSKQFKNGSLDYTLENLQPGEYSAQICAHSLAGNGSYTDAISFTVQAGVSPEDRSALVALVVCLVVLVLAVAGLVVFWFYRKRLNKEAGFVSPNPIYIPTDQLYVPDEWEVSRDNIRLIKELGQGSFGTVYEGLMEDPANKTTIPVAIKTVNDKADFHERLKILTEATTMKVFECHHVVKLLGVVSKGQPALVVMELMALGDLRNYLRRCRLEEDNYPEFLPPTNEQVHLMAAEIADGMAYLSDKKIVHRDLAARNCLVAQDGTVKIADFGMARDVYTTEYYRKDQRALLPVRWMAPESLQDGIYTTMSDIWSYGIVLWEIITLAEQPYQGKANDEVLHFVSEGHVMNPPAGCPHDLYELMRKCWSYLPRHRPTFMSVLETLEPHFSPKFCQVCFYFSKVAKIAADQKLKAAEAEQLEESWMHEDSSSDQDNIEADQDYDEDDLMMSENVSPEYADDRLEDSSYYASFAQNNLPSKNIYKNQGEDIPMVVHPHSMLEGAALEGQQQKALQYPALGSQDSCSEDSDSDYHFHQGYDHKYLPPYRDALSSSERLKLLSNSSPLNQDGPRTTKVLPFINNTGGSPYVTCSTGGPKNSDEYAFMSRESWRPSGDQAVLSHSPPSVSLLTQSSKTPSILPTFSPVSMSSPSPVLHIDSGVAGTPPVKPTSLLSQFVSPADSQSVKPTSMLAPGLSLADTQTGKSTSESSPAVSLEDTEPVKSTSFSSDVASLFLPNQTQRQSSSGDSRQTISNSSSPSNSNSIQSGSEGSKESSASSSSSRHGLGRAALNGHGPFTHHAACC